MTTVHSALVIAEVMRCSVSEKAEFLVTDAESDSQYDFMSFGDYTTTPLQQNYAPLLV